MTEKEQYVYDDIAHYLNEGVKIEVVSVLHKKNTYRIDVTPEYSSMDITGTVGAMVCDLMNSQSYDIIGESYKDHLCFIVVEILPHAIEEWGFKEEK